MAKSSSNPQEPDRTKVITAASSAVLKSVDPALREKWRSFDEGTRRAVLGNLYSYAYPERDRELFAAKREHDRLINKALDSQLRAAVRVREATSRFLEAPVSVYERFGSNFHSAALLEALDIHIEALRTSQTRLAGTQNQKRWGTGGLPLWLLEAILAATAWGIRNLQPTTLTMEELGSLIDEIHGAAGKRIRAVTDPVNLRKAIRRFVTNPANIRARMMFSLQMEQLAEAELAVVKDAKHSQP